MKMNFWQRLGVALATGYIWFYTGERVFWSFIRPGDTFLDPFLTWFVYSFFAYVCLTAISYFKVRSVASIFLVAALFGWLIEGLFALTLFGGPELPFPITISWTGLAWHASFILFCWYWMRNAIATSTTKTILGSVTLGLFWGVWSLAWALETPPVMTTPDLYLIHGVIATAVYILALHSYAWFGKGPFIPGKIEVTIGVVLMFLYYAIVTVPNVLVLALTVLPILCGIVLAGLAANRRKETRPDILATFQTRISWVRSLVVLIAPVIAAFIYATGVVLPTNVAFLIIFTLLGFGLFVWSLISVFRKPGAR